MRLGNRSGFALPLAILIIAVLTVAIAAGFSATTAETAANSTQRGQARAVAFSEAGLEQWMTNRSALCAQTGSVCLNNPDPGSGTTVDSEYVTVNFTGGYAQVKAVRVRPKSSTSDTTTVLFFVRSRGVDTTVKLGGGGHSSFAEHTVGMYATYPTQTMQVLAAWTSLGGFQKNGSAGVVSGIDQCAGATDTIAGLTTDSGAATTSGNWSPTGKPAWDSSSNLHTLENRMQINWAAVQGGAITADFTVPPDNFPSATWFTADTTRWPIIRIHTQNFGLPNAGRGMIIADSNFSISGSNMWNGVVLIGGQLTSNGNNVTAGATISGLNLLLPNTPQPGPGVLTDQSTANGQKQYMFNSCNVSQATKGLRTYKAIPNSWVDNLPSW